MTYAYSSTYGNMLETITEASDLTRGFKKVSAGASGYTYDNNGNVTADGYRGITGITYNYLNLPVKTTYSTTKYIEFTYDAANTKQDGHDCAGESLLPVWDGDGWGVYGG